MSYKIVKEGQMYCAYYNKHLVCKCFTERDALTGIWVAEGSVPNHWYEASENGDVEARTIMDEELAAEYALVGYDENYELDGQIEVRLDDLIEKGTKFDYQKAKDLAVKMALKGLEK